MYIHTIFFFAARLVLWILVVKGEGRDTHIGSEFMHGRFIINWGLCKKKFYPYCIVQCMYDTEYDTST